MCPGLYIQIFHCIVLQIEFIFRRSVQLCYATLPQSSMVPGTTFRLSLGYFWVDFLIVTSAQDFTSCQFYSCQQRPRHLCTSCLCSIKCDLGWHSTTSRITSFQVQGPQFNPELRLVSLWNSVYSFNALMGFLGISFISVHLQRSRWIGYSIFFPSAWRCVWTCVYTVPCSWLVDHSGCEPCAWIHSQPWSS